MAKYQPKDKFQKELGKRIRQVRKAKGFSLKQLEALDGSIDRSHLSKIENGTYTPDLYTIYKIASLLEEDISEFFKKESKKD